MLIGGDDDEHHGTQGDSVIGDDDDEYHGTQGDSVCPINCSLIDIEEHCDEREKKCKCGKGPSCIGTDKPLCHHGMCTGYTDIR